jgi:hypothetical protein
MCALLAAAVVQLQLLRLLLKGPSTDIVSRLFLVLDACMSRILSTVVQISPLVSPPAAADDQLRSVLDLLEAMSHHLTAAVVSNDIPFLQEVLAHTVNGTTYAGIRARTTGAPQNHWFGPAGDPRGAGIGTPEAIRLVWSCHREVIHDFGPCTATSQLKQS